ncbi:MAG: hypothetical protein O9301_01800 [Leptospira sp.]|nr:hypothetical protein [Leptospira sp.]
MEYAESLLTEYFELSEELKTRANEIQTNLIDELFSLEEEICFEFSLPATEKNRGLFRMIGNGETRSEYTKRALCILSTERTRYFYKPGSNFWDAVKAA